MPTLGSYRASKGAVVLMSRAMALEHAREGIRINVVCPNVIETPILIVGAGNVRFGSEADVPAPSL